MDNQRLRGVALALAAMAMLAVPQLASAKLRAPQPITPASGAIVDMLPAFGWSSVPGSDHYEYQLTTKVAGDGSYSGLVFDTIETNNTYVTVPKSLTNGVYFWHARAVEVNGNVGAWSPTRMITKRWTAAAAIASPANGAVVAYPQAVVLRWSPVRYAYRYRVYVASDPGLGSLETPNGVPDETSSTAYTFTYRIGPGTHYWAVVPLDAEGRPGTRSAVYAFNFVWSLKPANLQVTNVFQGVTEMDPQFSWSAVPGAAHYELQISTHNDFPDADIVYRNSNVIGTKLSPTVLLPNDTYYWRVRAVDGDGNPSVDWAMSSDAADPLMQQFTKVFDNGDGSDLQHPLPIVNLHMRDINGSVVPDSTGYTTQTPIVAWDPVPGASGYRVEVAPYDLAGCDWTIGAADHFDVRTAVTAWTPLAPGESGHRPKDPATGETVGTDIGKALVAGTKYCVRVTACQWMTVECDIVSPPQQIDGTDWAFTYGGAPYVDMPNPAHWDNSTLQASDYIAPLSGSFTMTPSLFTWKATPGARAYWVVVAKDPNFTNIQDVALTNVNAYAPRGGFGVTTYPLADTLHDTSYFWGVVPALGADGSGASGVPQLSQLAFPHFDFTRVSASSWVLTNPGENGTTVEPGTPVFGWTPVDGARAYRVQVSPDSSFGSSNLADDTVTQSTAYTSLANYSASTIYYWRVVALDEKLHDLAVSPTGHFTKTLEVPVVSPANQKSGDVMSDAERWAPTNGAVGYTVHIDQADGQSHDYFIRQPAFTFVKDYGAGVGHWEVRAEYPKVGGDTAHSAWSAIQTWNHTISQPRGLVTLARGKDTALVAWAPLNAGIKQYRVQVATRQDFSPIGILDDITVDGTSFAPTLQRSEYHDGGTLWWRVAAIDEGGNVGAWSPASPLTLSRAVRVQLLSYPLFGKLTRVRLKITDPTGKAVRGARVAVRGAGVRRATRLTASNGTVTFRLTARRRGLLVFTITRPGFQTTTFTQQVF